MASALTVVGLIRSTAGIKTGTATASCANRDSPADHEQVPSLCRVLHILYGLLVVRHVSLVSGLALLALHGDDK